MCEVNITFLAVLLVLVLAVLVPDLMVLVVLDLVLAWFWLL